ncbi:hypothetical protein DT23_13240 [Thioclava indica]|uniref:Uncharacterized protein n=1 Tax=Thioclava indica TaxID=1353528 RepID=A0A074JRM8_9RHOB|nr:hypothetical protein DT23_13240 [Thioclava indica]
MERFPIATTRQQFKALWTGEAFQSKPRLSMQPRVAEINFALVL